MAHTRSRTCHLGEKHVYYNFIVKGRSQHIWHWPDERGELKFVFMWHAWGVSATWLRQCTQRLVHTFSAF